MDDRKRTLANYKIKKAEGCLTDAHILFDCKSYDGAVNRSYYAMFNSVSALLALDGVAFSKHSSVIGYFQKNYVRPGIFSIQDSKALQNAFTIRQKCDYSDFYLVTREAVAEQISNAEIFIADIKKYLEKSI